MMNFVKVGLATLALGFVAQAGSAATTLCPGTAGPTDREFSVTLAGAATAGCVAFGGGNIDNTLDLGTISPAVLLDKSDDGVDAVGSLVVTISSIVTVTPKGFSGFWSILVPAGYELINAYIGFKTGEGQIDPDWALFSLPAGSLSGSWAVINTAARGNQNLSHANVYGNLVPATIPVPAAGFMLVGALAGLAALRRRRKLV